MGVANSALPAISTLVVEFTIMSAALALWLHRERGLTAWGVAAIFIVGWEVGVREAFNVDNPLNNYLPVTSPDYMQALEIYNGILVILCVLFALIGDFSAWIVDIAEVLPFYACIPLGPASSEGYVIDQTGTGRARRHSSAYTGLHRWGLLNLPRPYVHSIVSFILLLVCILIPNVVYSLYMDSNINIAYFTLIGVKLLGYIITYIFWAYFPDIYVFGPHVKNIKNLGERYVNRDLKKDTKLTDRRILKTLLTIGIIDFAGSLILGLVRYIDTDVDTNWEWAVGVGAVLFIVVALIGIALWFMSGGEEAGVQVVYVAPDEEQEVGSVATGEPSSTTAVPPEDDGEGDEETASTTVDLEGAFNTMSRRMSSYVLRS